MEVDWSGIRRARKAMGGEQALLLVKTARRHVAAQLDDAVPPDDGEGPANGGWFETPQGWMLFVEGLDIDVDPWIERLATSLTAAGVEGVLGGGRTVGRPKWVEPLRFRTAWSVDFGFVPDPDFHARSSWGGGTLSLQQAAQVGAEWLAAEGGQLHATVDLRANFRCDPDTAARIVFREVDVHHRAGLAHSYQSERQEVRMCDFNLPCCGSLSSQRATNAPWPESIQDLREVLLALPRERLSVAMVSHLSWTDYLFTDPPGAAYYSNNAYRYYPECWSEFTLDPCGIQILTDQHLTKANDLSEWLTTRLDDTHYLVEARNLADWYASPLTSTQPVPADLLTKARNDFGEIVITHERARELGIDKKPPRPR